MMPLGRTLNLGWVRNWIQKTCTPTLITMRFSLPSMLCRMPLMNTEESTSNTGKLEVCRSLKSASLKTAWAIGRIPVLVETIMHFLEWELSGEILHVPATQKHSYG